MLRKSALIIFLVLTILAVVVALKDDKRVTTTSNETYEHYLAGTEWMENFYFRQAMEELEQAVKLDSNFAMAQASLAQVYASRGFTKKFEEMKVTALANRSFVSHREQLQLDIFKAQWEGRLDEAFTLTQDFLRQFPEDQDALTTMAYQEFAREHYEESLALFQSVLKINPRYAPAFNMIGYLNFYLGRYDEALAMLDKYIELSREQANPHDSRGEILHSVGRYEEAIAEFRQAFNINPDFDFATLHMAQSYQQLGQNDQADYCYRILFDQGPAEAKKLQYHIGWAGMLIQREDYDSARSMLEVVFREDSTGEKNVLGDACRLLGAIYYRIENLDSLKLAWACAREYLDKEVAKKPQLADDRGILQYRRFMDATEFDLSGRNEDALKVFGELVTTAMTPEEKLGYRIYYANVLRRNNQLDLAISELQKNLSINPNHGKTLLRLADVYETAGDQASALAYRQRAVDLWKNADSDFIPLVKLREKLESSLASSPRTVDTPSAPASNN